MSLLDVVLFLFGNRSAITRALHASNTLFLSAIFVGNATLAVTYNRVHLISRPYWVLVPILASIAITLLVRFSCDHTRIYVRTKSGTFPLRLISVWSLVSLTFIITTLVGVPCYKLFTPKWLDLSLLLQIIFVAFWQVALIIRILSVMVNVSWFAAAGRIMPWVCIAVILVAIVPPYINFSMPGRLLVMDSEGHFITIGGLNVCCSVVFFPFWVIVAWRGKKATQWCSSHTVELMSFSESSRPGWILVLVLSIVIWTCVLPISQGQQARKEQVLRLFDTGRIRDAIELMEKHDRNDFPELWQPPPRLLFTNGSPHILDIMDVIVDFNVQGWVREVYLRELKRYMGSSLTFNPLRFPNDRGKIDLKRTTALLERMPEGPRLVRRHVPIIKLLIDEEWEVMTDEEQLFLCRWIGLASRQDVRP